MSEERFQNEISRLYTSASRIKDCFHNKKEECKGKIKQAHSIQKNGKLSILESEVNGNMSVYTFANSRSSFENLMEELTPVGKKEASTFYGFCDFHDSKLFSKIENNKFDHSDEHIFLHTYRSFAHSYHTKNEEIKAWNDSKYQQILQATYGKEVVDIKIKQFQALEKHVLEEKQILDSSLENNEFDNLNYFVYEFNGIVPLAVSGIITPSVSFSGKLMNNSDYDNLVVSSPIFTLLPDVNTSFLIIAAFNFDTRSTEYIDEIYDMPQFKFEKAISSIIIDSCQNTIISPKFWDNLPSVTKRLILKEYSEKSLMSHSNKKAFWSQFNFFKPEYFIK